MYFCNSIGGNMKKSLFLLFLLLFGFSSYSQDYRKNIKEAEKIKANHDFYWGESGDCKSMGKADDAALTSLLKSITNDKSLQYLYFVDSENDDDEQRNKALLTFRDEMKKQSYDIVLNDGDGKSKVFRYISKNDFSKLCSTREKKINDYIADGLTAEEQLRYGNALRYYYWALMLCYSHPNGAGLTYKSDGVNSVPTYRWLQRHIEDVLTSININPRRQEKAGDNEFILSINNGSESIEGLDFSYNNGNGSAKGYTQNGLSYIKMIDHGMDEVVISIELENKTIVKGFDPEVYGIMDKLDEQIIFPGARKVVNIEKAKKIKNLEEAKSYANSSFSEEYERSEQFMNSMASPHAEYVKIMDEIEKALAKKDKKADDFDKFFTPEGMALMRKLISYGKVRVIGKPTYRFIDFGDEVICRSIPMQFDFSHNVSFMRDVVFRFDNNTKKVKSIAFRCSDITESQILGKELWSKEARLTLISFIEDYQTAYALQRKDYLEQIFSDNALIIVGTVLKKTKQTDDFRMKQNVMVKYDTLSKSQYLSRLNRVFDNNEFVNLNFTNTKFNTVNGKNNVIGVQLRQEYFSSTYSDVGYLFLMVDLRDELPVIHVRTWQPNETPVDELIDNTSFILR